MVTVVSMHQAYSPSQIFHIYRTAGGRWRASSGDGSVGGIFFERSAALRFAAREGDGVSVLVLDDDLASHIEQIGPGQIGFGPKIAKC
jgi:hypothetical protein